jgi:hypothetical protein
MVGVTINNLFLVIMVRFLVPLVKGEKYGDFSLSSPGSALSIDRAG